MLQIDRQLETNLTRATSASPAGQPITKLETFSRVIEFKVTVRVTTRMLNIVLPISSHFKTSNLCEKKKTVSLINKTVTFNLQSPYIDVNMLKIVIK